MITKINKKIKNKYIMMKTGKPSRLVLIRHGESISNKKKENGFVPSFIKDEFMDMAAHNVKLTAEGMYQAVMTGRKIKEIYGSFDYIYTSPFARTRDTTTGILSAYKEEKIQMQYRENLFIRERDAGYAFSMTENESNIAFPWLRQYWKVHGNFYSTPPGGESIAKVAERVYQFIDMLLQRRGGQNVLIVTHGGTIRCFRYIIEHWSPEQAEVCNDEGSPINCGVTTYTVDEQNKFVLQQYNQKYW